MERKVNRSGPSTLTVSLPIKWVRNRNVKAGDSVEILEAGRNLEIVYGKMHKRKKKVFLQIDDLNSMLINRYLHEFYRQGVEEIILKFEKEKIEDYKRKKKQDISRYVKKIIERFIGLEIISQSKNKIILQSLVTAEESSKLDVVQRRVYFLIKEFLDDFLKSINNDFKRFHSVSYDYHDNIAKFTYYYLRLLNFSDKPPELKARLFELFMIVDKVIDKLRHTSERIYKAREVSEKVKKCLSSMFRLFLAHFDVILKNNYTIEDLERLIKSRYELVSRIHKKNFTFKEFKIVNECSLILDISVDFSESYAALNFEKYVAEF